MPDEPDNDDSMNRPTNEAPGWAAFVLFYVLFLGAVLISLLVNLWPIVNAANKSQHTLEVVWGLFSVSKITPNTALIILAAVVGGLGAFVHAATSIADYLGNRRFVASWTPWYVVRLPIGAFLAVLFYFVVRAGFFGTDAGSADVNPFGIAALAGLAGLFSKQATDKLRETFETLFKVDPARGDAERGDSLGNPKPVLREVKPNEAHAGSAALPIRLLGRGFVKESVVRVNGANHKTDYGSEGR